MNTGSEATLSADNGEQHVEAKGQEGQKHLRECQHVVTRPSHFEPLLSLAASFLGAGAALMGTLAPSFTMAKSSRERAWYGTRHLLHGCALLFLLMDGQPHETGMCSFAGTHDTSHGRAIYEQCYHSYLMPSDMGDRALLTCRCAPALVCLAALPFALQAECEEGE